MDAAQVSKRAKSELRRMSRVADKVVGELNPRRRMKAKYDAEHAFWQTELAALMAWYEGRAAWLGVPSPATDERVPASAVPAADAVMAFHRARPYYLVHLMVEPQHFAGRRVLEVGCGPMAPVLQFSDCERHGIDPLVNSYIADGWPMYAFDGTFINARAEEMPYPNDYFDAAISVNALDHVDDFEATAAEMLRVVKPGGELRFEVEYHAATVTEPLALDDDVVRQAFGTGSTLTKVSERPAHEVYTASRIVTDHRNEPFALWSATVR